MFVCRQIEIDSGNESLHQSITNLTSRILKHVLCLESSSVKSIIGLKGNTKEVAIRFYGLGFLEAAVTSKLPVCWLVIRKLEIITRCFSSTSVCPLIVYVINALLEVRSMVWVSRKERDQVVVRNTKQSWFIATLITSQDVVHVHPLVVCLFQMMVSRRTRRCIAWVDSMTRTSTPRHQYQVRNHELDCHSCIQSNEEEEENKWIPEQFPFVLLFSQDIIQLSFMSSHVIQFPKSCSMRCIHKGFVVRENKERDVKWKMMINKRFAEEDVTE